MPTSPSPTTTPAIFTRATLALAASHRLISSWLPPVEISTTNASDAELETERQRERQEQEQEEEEEMFTAMPEVLGVGATLPQDNLFKREELSSNETLRRQLLGRDYKRVQAGAGRGDKGPLRGGVVVVGGSKPRPVGSKREVTVESEDEGGRSSVGKSKRKRGVEHMKEGAQISDGEVTRLSKASMGTSRPQKGAANYLDQVLAEKSRRQRKKSKKRKKHDSES